MDTRQNFPRPSPSATLDIELLRSFLAISETGSMTQAARTVARSTAAVSMQIKRLEETLGRSLFDRGPRGMTLNVDGEMLLGYARRMIALHQDALDRFRAPALSGEVRVGMIDDFGGVRLSEVLAAFSRTHPAVMVTMTMGPTATLHKRLEKGELDLSLLTPGCATPWRDSDIALHEESLVWAGRIGGCAHRRRPLPLAMSAGGCAWRKAALGALDEAGLAYRIVYTSEFYEAQKAALTADLAIAPLPRSIVQPPFEPLRDAGLPAPGTCRLVLRFGAVRNGAIDALATRIRESYGAADGADSGRRQA